MLLGSKANKNKAVQNTDIISNQYLLLSKTIAFAYYIM